MAIKFVSFQVSKQASELKIPGQKRLDARFLHGIRAFSRLPLRDGAEEIVVWEQILVL